MKNEELISARCAREFYFFILHSSFFIFP